MVVRSVRALRALCPLVLAVPLAAQWQQADALNPPPFRFGYTLTPMPNGELLLFGGDVNNPAATEYAWNGVAWRPVSTPVPRRLGHAMGVDVETDTLVLHGGIGAAGALSDTWRFDGTTWTNVPTLHVPPALSDPSMAFDPADGSMVLLGTNQVTFATETWRLRMGDWQQEILATLSGGSPHVVYDSVRRETAAIVHSGSGVDTYRLSGGAWTLASSSSTGQSLGGSLFAAFDHDRGRTLAIVLGLPQPVTWQGDGLHGSTFAGAPPVSFAAAMAYHAARSETVFVSTTAPLSVWRWAPDAVPLATAFGAPCQDPAFAFGLAAGDSPQPGASHRLEATGASGAFVTLAVLGFSHTTYAGLPLPLTIPLGAAGCQLRVEAAIVSSLGLGLPQSLLIAVPNSASLLGAHYDAQALQLDASGVPDSSNGLDVQIGAPLPQQQLVETFASAANRDPLTSGDVWANGVVTAAAIGGDGRHGSFDATLGQALGNGVYVWNVDNMLIPAMASLTGQSYLVTDGRFYFTDLIVPQGTTVRFVGSVPPIVRVRGRIDVQGTIDVNGQDLPYVIPTSGPGAGLRLSTFNARNGTLLTIGQTGTAGGAGGGRGGRGANECANAGPIVIGGEVLTDGAPGEDVRLAAGHAYASSAAGTGGRGGELTPSTGISPSLPAVQLLGSLYLPFFSPGGAGGGFGSPGSQAATPVLSGLVPIVAGTIVPAGTAFPVSPYPTSPPAGYSSLTHFTVGGSGGGGGGSHGFGLFGLVGQVERWMAGSGGTGGGGACALRAGGPVTIGAVAALEAKGGTSVLINGRDPAGSIVNATFGVSSPGGGGSGGSFLIQSADVVSVLGTVDTSGSAGSEVGQISTPQFAATGHGGAGSSGFFRLEATNGVAFNGTSVPLYNASTNSGALNDRDARTGSRSRWLLPATTALPVYLRYELLALVNGVPVVFSDDSSVSPLPANDPNGPVSVRFQGARIDPLTGQPVAATVGPWRASLAAGDDSINRDRAETLRFDLVIDTTSGPVQVQELRIVWR